MVQVHQHNTQWSICGDQKHQQDFFLYGKVMHITEHVKWKNKILTGAGQDGNIVVI